MGRVLRCLASTHDGCFACPNLRSGGGHVIVGTAVGLGHRLGNPPPDRERLPSDHPLRRVLLPLKKPDGFLWIEALETVGKP